MIDLLKDSVPLEEVEKPVGRATRYQYEPNSIDASGPGTWRINWENIPSEYYGNWNTRLVYGHIHTLEARKIKDVTVCWYLTESKR